METANRKAWPNSFQGRIHQPLKMDKAELLFQPNVRAEGPDVLPYNSHIKLGTASVFRI